MLSATSTPVDLQATQDTASRYADIALTANLAATALRLKRERPDDSIPGRFKSAYDRMLRTMQAILELTEANRLDALLDSSLGLVNELEPVQLVARLASNLDRNSSVDDAHTLKMLRKWIPVSIETPLDIETSERLVQLFKEISRQAMSRSQSAKHLLDHEADQTGGRARVTY